MSSDATTDSELVGGCGCGAVRWRLDEPPRSAAYCHCRRCQRRTGTAKSAGAGAVPGSFHLTAGAELVRAWTPEGGWEKHFCGECGSALFSRNPDDPTQVAVRLGSFDGDPGVRPSLHQFVDFAAEWEPIPDDGLPRYGGRRPD